MHADALTVAWIGLVTALATGLGALPFLFVPTVSSRWIGRGDALAAGLMLGATGGLLVQGLATGAVSLLAGTIVGAVAVGLGSRIATGREPAVTAAGTSGLVLVAVMTLHSCAEGIGVGVAFAGGDRIGFAIATAIAVHNVPEGLAISLVLVPAGASVGRAAALSVLSSVPQPLLAVPAFLLVDQFEPLLPWGFGLAAGAMLWMVFGRLLVDARAEISRRQVVLVAASGFVVMALLQVAVGV